MRFVFLCIESNNAPALRQAAASIEREYGLRLAIDYFTPPDMHTTADWGTTGSRRGPSRFCLWLDALRRGVCASIERHSCFGVMSGLYDYE